MSDADTTAGIVGAGAMGTLFAALFDRARVAVRLLETDPGTVAALSRGAVAYVDGREHRFTAHISPSPETLSGCDPVFFFVKSYHTGAAARETAAHIGRDATVVSLQNGLGNVDALAAAFGADRLVYGTTTIGATRTGPASVRLGGHGAIVIGGKDPARVSRVATILSLTGEEISVTDDPARAQWEKAIVNAAINPVFALLGAPNGASDGGGHIERLQRTIVHESVEAALLAGHRFDADALFAKVRDVCRRTAANLCSMQQDIAAGRRTEIDSITGAIISAGESGGLPMAASRTLYGLVRAREGLAPLTEGPGSRPCPAP